MTSAPIVPVITLKWVAKVFLTDEVETHALSDLNLDVAKGEYLSEEQRRQPGCPARELGPVKE